MAGKTVDGVKTGETIKATPVSRFVAKLELEAQMDSGNTGDFVDTILANMLEAATLEEVIEAQNAGSTSGKDLVNVELEVRHFFINKGSDRYKTPLKHYMIVDDVVRLDTLEQAPFNTGAPNVFIGLWKARETNRMPLQCVIRSRETDNGELLTLELLPKRPLDDGPSF